MTWLRRTLYAIVAPIGVALMRTAWWSYRYSATGNDSVRKLLADGEPLILTFWHEHIFAMAPYLLRLGRMGANVTFLVSPSVDGDLVVRMLTLMKANAVRGSATRSGVKAMKGLYRAIVRDNGSPVVLPDGPQGPRHECKPGSLLLAQMSGARILPMTCVARKALRLRTWDRMVVPLPFSSVEVIVGDSYAVASGISSEELESERVKLENILLRLGE
jgi:lysophospholipid acyltransferase (LPLAT)-like uncharacterized protein